MKTSHKVIIFVVILLVLIYYFNNKKENILYDEDNPFECTRYGNECANLTPKHVCVIARGQKGFCVKK